MEASCGQKAMERGLLCKPWINLISPTRSNSRIVFVSKRYFSITCKTFPEKNGARVTAPNLAAARDAIGVAQNTFRLDFLPTTDAIEIVEDKVQISKEATESTKWIDAIRYMFRSMKDGEISASAYDCAWVALVPALDGSGQPQFPATLQWIIDQQFADGSWGDSQMFHVRERIVNTLACVIALKRWNTVPQSVNKGLSFLRKYIPKINEEDDVYSPIGFEIVFPALLEDSKAMNLDLPYDGDFLRKIYDERALKLKRIPMDVVHNYPSTLLHSLEGLQHMVDWDNIMKLQCKDGSFLFSPASTACALARTGDANCLRYLNSVIEKHNGGVPNVYPVDLFEHLWMVDRLERLGISRHFKKEITDSLEYVYRYWTTQGIGWARDSPVKDVDDTSMAFRLLRLHGFHVTTEAFDMFKQGDQFICFAGQASQAVTGMYNLFRASQVLFPGESILEEAQTFTKNFLEEKRKRNQISDKWIMSKGLVGEVEYALDFPWYASQSRIETSLYINQYGEDDVWIGKTFYRMPFVNNNSFMELAKADFKLCQSIHRKELHDIIRWCAECRFVERDLVPEDSIVKAYFLAAVALFEPDVASARLAWAYSCIIMEAVKNLFSRWNSSPHDKQQFLEAFTRSDVTAIKGNHARTAKQVLRCLFSVIKMLSVDGALVQGRDINGDLRSTWENWLADQAREVEDEQNSVIPEAEVIVMSASFMAGEALPRDFIRHPDFTHTINLTNKICSLLQAAKNFKERDGNVKRLKLRAEEAMRELVRIVHEGQNEVPSTVKEMCLSVSKSFYYAAHCSDEEMGHHVDMVLFQPY